MRLTIPTCISLVICSATMVASNKPTPSSDYTGYVQCTSKKNGAPVPVFDDVCADKPNGSINCGEQVAIIERRGPWLKIKTADGREVYLGVLSISRVKNKFIPVTAPVDSQFDRRACIATKMAAHPEGTHAPRAIYAPDPEYPSNDSRKPFYGAVTLSVTIGTDGRPRDITVEKPLGDDFDRNAIEALKQWQFDPALKDGQPVETKIKVEMTYRR